MECMNCHGHNTTKGIKITLILKANSIGLAYNKGLLGFNEPIYAELCNDCGTIVRLYVREYARDWAYEKE